MFIFMIRLSSYLKRVTGVDKVAEELYGELNQFEKHLVMSQDVVEVRGKVCIPLTCR